MSNIEHGAASLFLAHFESQRHDGAAEPVQPAEAPSGGPGYPSLAPVACAGPGARLRGVSPLQSAPSGAAPLVRSRRCNAPPGIRKAPARALVPPRWSWHGPGGRHGLCAVSVGNFSAEVAA